MNYIIILIALLASNIAIGQAMPAPDAIATGEHEGEPIYLVKDLIPDLVQKLLYGGTRSVAGEFLPMGFLGGCTGTAIGPKVYLTAAHCTRDRARSNFRSRFDGKSYAATCYRHPNVNTRNWYNDYALCKLDGQFPADMPLVTVDLVTPAVGTDMMPNGFGAPTLGTHHWGRAKISSHGTQDLVTCGPANAGGGDSGASLIYWHEDRSGKSGFKVVAVLSRGNSRCTFYNRLNCDPFKTWANTWMSSHSVQICGMGLDCLKGQPDPEPPPPPDPDREPLLCWDTYERFEFCIGTSGNEQCIKMAGDLKQCVK